MIILRPTDDVQTIRWRTREPSGNNSRVIIICQERGFDSVEIVARDSGTVSGEEVIFSDGYVQGGVKVFLNGVSDEINNIRVFSAQGSGASSLVTQSETESIKLTIQQWIDLMESLFIENIKEIYRGSVLITDQTDLDKYKIYE